MSQTRIALIMGGGVSLGSFSAGALARLLDLLAYVERGPAKIDVVTGASAGSMTLGVMLYHLFRGSSTEQIRSSLRRAWVERITFDALCPDPTAHRTPSLFSDRIVRSIASEELRFDQWDGAATPHPYFAEGALVSFALTNMNGIPVRADGQMIRQREGEGSSEAQSTFADAVQTTFHDDVARFVLRREGARPEEDAGLAARLLEPWRTGRSAEDWEVFREAAIASGAFPAAFPPVRLRRRRSEFSIWPEEFQSDEFTFDYVDGGVLRNEPLREAIHLAGARDAGAEGTERVFIFIDPNVSGTRELYPLPYNQSLSLHRELDESGDLKSSRLEEPGYMARLTSVVGRLVGALTSQAAFRDWLRAAKVNSQIEWRDELLEIVAELEPSPGSDAPERIDRLLEKIYREKLMRGANPEPTALSLDSVRQRVRTDLAQRADGVQPTFATKLALLIDLVSNLRSKRKVNMVAITPTSGAEEARLPIAGNFLKNFGGFFDEEYRSYDFAVGEYLAAEVLRSPIPGARRLLLPGAPAADRPAKPTSDPSYRGLPTSVQQRFEKLVENHARAVAPMIGLPGLLHRVFVSKVRSVVRSRLLAEHAGREANFMVEIAGAHGCFLRKSIHGEDVAADETGRLRTVVCVRERDEVGGGCELMGPNVLLDGGSAAAVLEIRRRRLLRPSLLIARVKLDGPSRDWFRGAQYSAAPVLKVQLDRSREVTLTPDRVEAEV